MAAFPTPLQTAWRWLARILVVLAMMSLFAACSRPAPVALIFNPAPWQDGETHTFRVTDVDGNRAGVATYAVTAGAADDGEAMWSLLRSTQTQGDTETVTTKVSAAGFARQLRTWNVRTLPAPRLSTRSTTARRWTWC